VTKTQDDVSVIAFTGFASDFKADVKNCIARSIDAVP
jgi:hypothetical protein